MENLADRRAPTEGVVFSKHRRDSGSTTSISHLLEEKGQRNEHYEIKPDNEPNTLKGQEQLDAITRNYSDLNLPHARLQGLLSDLANGDEIGETRSAVVSFEKLQR